MILLGIASNKQTRKTKRLFSQQKLPSTNILKNQNLKRSTLITLAKARIFLTAIGQNDPNNIVEQFDCMCMSQKQYDLTHIWS